ncbi:MAG: amidohydrolase [Agriterribacter sp.]
MSTISLTTVQTNLFWENRDANLQMFESKICSIADKTEIVILPEMFSTGFSMRPEKLAEKMDGFTVNWMRNISAKKKVILTGSLIIEDREQYFNRLIWMLPDGNFGWYDKRHLFAFAGEHKHYTGGEKRLIASVKGWKINLQVCYDLRFPVWVRQQNTNSGILYDKQKIPEYDLVIYVANWPQRRNHAWKTLLQARAIENQCYVAGVNRVGDDGNGIYHSGDSMIVDPLGEVLYTKADTEDIHTAILQKDKLEEVRSKFPFWKDADNFSIEP